MDGMTPPTLVPLVGFRLGRHAYNCPQLLKDRFGLGTQTVGRVRVSLVAGVIPLQGCHVGTHFVWYDLLPVVCGDDRLVEREDVGCKVGDRMGVVRHALDEEWFLKLVEDGTRLLRPLLATRKKDPRRPLSGSAIEVGLASCRRCQRGSRGGRDHIGLIFGIVGRVQDLLSSS